MAVKSIVDIEVNDDDFKEFAALFAKYRSALGETPDVWHDAEKAVEGTALNVENLVAGLLTHEAINRKIANEEEKKARQLERQERAMRGLSVSARDVAKSTKNIFMSLAKWSSVFSVGGGLLGFGSLLGLDRLALDVGRGRRTAQGLGSSYGEEKAFRNVYGRIVDPNNLLSGVNESLTDVTKRAALYGAGLSERDVTGRSSVEVANTLLPHLKRLADRTPDSQLAQMAQARGLNQFVTVEDLRRLKATSPEELAGFRASYATRRREFNLQDAVAQKWQDLGVQLDSAKLKIENVLVRGLTPLAKPLSELSESIANAIDVFLKGLDPQTIKDFGKGIEDFAKYLSSDAFKKDLKDFADDASYAAKKMASVLRFLGLIPDKDPESWRNQVNTAARNSLDPNNNTPLPAGSWLNDDPNRHAKWYDPGSWLSKNGGLRSLFSVAPIGSGKPVNNPGNLRSMKGGFQQFTTRDDGVRAMANQLQRYQYSNKFGHADTLSKIITTYAPPSENDTQAYIRDVATRTGIDPNKHIDLNDEKILAKVVAAMARHENRKNKDTPESVLKILNAHKVSSKDTPRIGTAGTANVIVKSVPVKNSAKDGVTRDAVIKVLNDYNGNAQNKKPALASNDAGKRVDELAKHYGDDLRKVVAAYTWGQKNVDKDVAMHGKDWEKFVPDDVRKQLDRVMRIAAKGGTEAVVKVFNNTGGSAIIQSSQVAKQ